MVHSGNTKAPTKIAKVRRRGWRIFWKSVERFFLMLNGFRERVKNPNIFWPSLVLYDFANSNISLNLDIFKILAKGDPSRATKPKYRKLMKIADPVLLSLFMSASSLMPPPHHHPAPAWSVFNSQYSILKELESLIPKDTNQNITTLRWSRGDILRASNNTYHPLWGKSRYRIHIAIKFRRLSAVILNYRKQINDP